MRMKLVVKVENMETNLALLQNGNNSLSYQDKHKVLQKIKVDLCGSNNNNYIEELLCVLGPEIRQETRYTGIILEILTILLPKLQDDVTFTQLTEIAESILHLLISTMKFKAESLHVSCVNVLLLYRSNQLVLVMEAHSDKLLALLDQEIAEENVKTFILQLTKHCLGVQPADVQRRFAVKGASVWFSRIVPLLFSNSKDLSLALEIVERLIPNLNLKDYNKNINFQTFVAHIQNQTYPHIIIAKLRQSAYFKTIWDRVWICTARLLGKNINHNHSTINPLLLVLETAFKMDIHRLKGFKCWKVLIDMFNEKEIQSRIKLLTVPFTHISVKPDAISTKLDVWLHLLNLLRPNIELHAKLVLMPFIHFCFGAKQDSTSLYKFPAVVTYPALNSKVLKTLVEIFGHLQCDSCQSEYDTMITSQMFSDYLDDWKHSMHQCLKLIAALDDENWLLKKKTVVKDATCLFSSFLYFAKSGHVKDVLDLITDIAEEYPDNSSVQKLMTNVLLPFILDENKGFPVSTFASNTQCNRDTPLVIITNILVACKVNDDSAISLGGKFKNLIEYIASQDDPTYVLHQLQADPFGTHLYTSLIKSSFERINDNGLCNLFLWPANKLHPMELIGDIVEAWSMAYNKHKITNELNDDIINGMTLGMNISNISIFLLPIALSKRLSLKPDLSVQNDDICIFVNVLHQLKEWKTNSLVLNLSKYILLFIEASIRIKIINFLSKEALTFIQKFVVIVITFCSDDVAEILAKTIDKIYFMASNNFDSVFGILEACANNTKLKPLQEKALTKISTLLSNKTFTTSEKKKLKEILDAHKKNCMSEKPCVNLKDDAVQLQSNDKAVMKPPNLQNKSMIIQYHDKNEEELIVIPPKWKFNPKKLTEHQKEKFEQRREDIPALYQDMSQSRDDNSLHSWQPTGYRTDSQDTSSETKNTTNKAEKILQEIPNSDVCPNIINTLLVSMSPNNEKKIVNEEAASNKKDQRHFNFNSENNSSNKKITIVKNLYLDMQSNQVICDTTDNIILSPNPADDLKLIETKAIEANKTHFESNRVPHVSSTSTEKERPLRIKKKPKKFDPHDHVISKTRKSTDLNGEKCLEQKNHSLKLDDKPSEINAASEVEIIDKFLTNDDKGTGIKVDPITNNSEVYKPNKIKVKRNYKIKSRLESQLQIDMVEGHPLENIDGKRLRLNKIIASAQTKVDLNIKPKHVSNGRNSVDNSQILKKGSKRTVDIEEGSTGNNMKSDSKDLNQEHCNQMEFSPVECAGIVKLTQRENSCLSEDVIESSQDSTSSSSTIRTRASITKANQTIHTMESNFKENVLSENIFDAESNKMNNAEFKKSIYNESKETDIIIEDAVMTEDFSDKHQESLLLSNSSNLQCTAEIDTELVTTQDVENLVEKDAEMKLLNDGKYNQDEDNINCHDGTIVYLLRETKEITSNEIVSTVHLISSPHKDDADKRTTDFLNSTLDMSPIKACAQINLDSAATEHEEINIPALAESSPDVFSMEKALTEEHMETCNDSPPRCSLITTISSPSISSSYKKNRPNVTGRGAQMLGLCVPDKVGTLQFSNGVNAKTKNNPSGISVPNRNFKMVYKTSSEILVNDDSQISVGNNASDEGLTSEVPLNLLIFSKILPDPHASPSGSILKRKRDDTLEEVSSPASKKKRVSFHDPPVSITKYIECPPSPVHKSSKTKLKMRTLNYYFDDISPLDNDQEDDDTQATDSLLEKTETELYIKNSVLNNDEPIYPSLVGCCDKISNITAQLASPLWENCMREELLGKVKTIGEFASLTEYEVSLLSIKFPKIETARSILADYFCKWQEQIANKKTEQLAVEPIKINIEYIPLPTPQSEPKTCDASQNTDIVLCDASQNTDPDLPANENDVHVQSFMDNHSLNDIIDIYMKRQEQTNNAFTADDRCKIITSLDLEQIYRMTDGNDKFFKKILSVGKDNPSSFLRNVIEEYSAKAILTTLPDTDLLNYIVQNNSVNKFLHLLGKTLMDNFENK